MTSTAQVLSSAVDCAVGSATPHAVSAPPTKRPLWRRALRFIERGLAICGLVLIVWLAGFQLVVTHSNSMAPTLKGNGKAGSDLVICERFSYWFRAPRRWELTSYNTAEGLHVMKRVVALPGEKLALKKVGTFIVNGEAIERPESLKDIRYYPIGRLAYENATDVGSGYFVLGDDSRDSQDSRFEESVDPESLCGRPWLIVWPLSRFGFVNP